MWYTILITLIVDLGGLVLVYLLLRDRVRRAASAEARVAEIREEVSRLLVELNQATDRNVALMEDRIGALNEAISTADKKIGLLRRETEKHDVGSRIYSRLAEGRPPRPDAWAEAEGREGAETRAATEERPPGTAPASPPVPPLAVELSERPSPLVRADARGNAAAAGGREAARPASPRGLQPGSSEPGGSEPAARAADVRQRVMMLFRAGFSPSLIASRVGASVGEVELIISLEQRKGSA